MTAGVLDVLIAGKLAGTLSQDGTGSLSFAYERGYRGVPLSSSMPLSTRPYRDKVVPSYLWGLLPEDPAARRHVAADAGISPNNPFALLGVIGLDCPGAVQFVPQGSDACRDEDKDLRDHGLIQAFSRANRILNSVKSYGNIVCFRNLEDRVNHAISLFGDKEAGGVVLLKPYAEYLGENRERLAQLREQFPPEAILNGNALLGEEAEKAFIRLFGVILHLRNILTAFDDFAADDTLSPRDEQDYRSVYTDLYQKWRKQKEDATIINDDLVFEVELLKQVDINIDYVLMLVQKYHDSNCTDKMIIGDIERAIGASYELRNKKDLIEAFIDSLDSSNDVTADWEKYLAETKERELSAIIEEEALDDAATREFMANAFVDGGVPESGTEMASLMTKEPSRFAPANAYADRKARALDRLKTFFDRFNGLGR